MFCMLFSVLPTPMGKGVIPDDHPLVVSAARSKVLGNSIWLRLRPLASDSRHQILILLREYHP